MARTLHQLVENAAIDSLDRPVLLAPRRRDLTWSALREQLDLVARSLREAGVGRSDVVASMLPNGPEAATAFAGIATAARAAPLNPAYRAAELRPYLQDLNPKLMLLGEDGGEEAEEACAEAGVPVWRISAEAAAGAFTLSAHPVSEPSSDAIEPSPDDVALILHTSGTTSRPKMVPLSHANLAASAANVAASLELGPRDRCLNVMPLFHIHGLVASVLATLGVGGSLVATPGFYATDFFSWLGEYQPTWYSAVPTIHQAVVERGARLSGIDQGPLRLIRSSSASLAPAVMAQLEATFGVPVVEAYGMTEAAHQIACNPLPPRLRKPGTVGPSAGPEVGVMDDRGRLVEPETEGEVVVRGPNVTRGYIANPEANVDSFVDGWFRTGDLGVLDTDGYLRLTGRRKEMINRGGETIAPREIDDMLLEHADVRQVLTFAVPDARLGEQVAAAVVLEAGSTADEEELRRWMGERLSTNKVPRRIVFMDAIPKGPTGKLQRIGLAERLGLRDLDEGDRSDGSPVAPRTPVEELVAGMWAEILGIGSPGVEDRFLDLGGDSMLATRLLARIRETLQLDMSMVEFFDRPTVAAQSELIEELLLADE